MKTCNNEHSKWVNMGSLVFWADWVTVLWSIGYSLFFMAHGVEAVLPFDIAEATYLLPLWTSRLQPRTSLRTCPTVCKNARKTFMRCRPES